MNKHNKSLSRRCFITMGTAITLVAPLFGWSRPSEQLSSATWRITAGRRSIGIKISQDSRGQFMMSARVIGGKKLIIVPMGTKKGSLNQKSYTKTYEFEGCPPVELNIDRKGTVSSNLKEAKFGPMDYNPSRGPEHQTQGLWSWLGGLISDVAAVFAGFFLFLRGDSANMPFLGGTLWFYGSSNSIVWEPGNGGFMLEPGTEGDPNVWY